MGFSCIYFITTGLFITYILNIIGTIFDWNNEDQGVHSPKCGGIKGKFTLEGMANG